MSIENHVASVEWVKRMQAKGVGIEMTREKWYHFMPRWKHLQANPRTRDGEWALGKNVREAYLAAHKTCGFTLCHAAVEFIPAPSLDELLARWLIVVVPQSTVDGDFVGKWGAYRGHVKDMVFADTPLAAVCAAIETCQSTPPAPKVCERYGGNIGGVIVGCVRCCDNPSFCAVEGFCTERYPCYEARSGVCKLKLGVRHCPHHIPCPDCGKEDA